MTIFKTYLTLSSVFLLSASASFAMDVEPESKENKGTTIRKSPQVTVCSGIGIPGMVSRTFKRAFKITFRGSENGEQVVVIDRASLRQPANLYSRLNETEDFQLTPNAEPSNEALHEGNQVYMFPLDNIDLRKFKGNISIKAQYMQHVDESWYDDVTAKVVFLLQKGFSITLEECCEEGKRAILTIPFKVDVQGKFALTENAQDVRISLRTGEETFFHMVKKLHADVTIGTGDIKYLRSLALEKTEANIQGIHKKEFSKKEINKALPQEVSELIRDETWKARKEMIKKAKKTKSRKGA